MCNSLESLISLVLQKHSLRAHMVYCNCYLFIVFSASPVKFSQGGLLAWRGLRVLAEGGIPGDCAELS